MFFFLIIMGFFGVFFVFNILFQKFSYPPPPADLRFFWFNIVQSPPAFPDIISWLSIMRLHTHYYPLSPLPLPLTPPPSPPIPAAAVSPRSHTGDQFDAETQHAPRKQGARIANLAPGRLTTPGSNIYFLGFFFWKYVHIGKI